MIRRSRLDDFDRVIEIWRKAVDATHGFLAPLDRSAIEVEVRGFLPLAPLWLAVDHQDNVLGFILTEGSHLEALFIDPDQHRRGIGSRLLVHANGIHPVVSADVNEQNPNALRFYQRHGFTEIGRSPHDSDGRPYPILHLRRSETARST
ncbi:putative acetyltransferase [Rhodanobacter sp. K2T2]|uniref:acetyltransferase n=1 Tax=Rhodanobacter sp. K2T2 TaxID=2723085 RepID=UPI0015C86739|nr:acetyltransferase [Rhodanobacter sp. K2T2]NYE28939.1 putative acetyltransferase [Rhodanobacter sp. K2T2]